MRAPVIDELVPGLERDELVRLRDVAAPEIVEPDEVIVRIGGAGVCTAEVDDGGCASRAAVRGSIDTAHHPP